MTSGLENESGWTKKINYKNEEIRLTGKNIQNGCSSATQF